MSDQNTASDHQTDAVSYLIDPSAWQIPANLQSAAFNLVNANWQTQPGMQAMNETIEQRIKTLEDTSTHINVAKDQENRIVELESAVGELMEYIKELKIQRDLEKATFEKEKMEAFYRPVTLTGMTLSSGGGAQYAQGFSSHQVFSAPTPPLPEPPPEPIDSLIDKGKRMLGIK